MFVSHIASASLIVAFDLEKDTANDSTVSQKVAGYFVLVSVCLFVASATLSVGYVTLIGKSVLAELSLCTF